MAWSRKKKRRKLRKLAKARCPIPWGPLAVFESLVQELDDIARLKAQIKAHDRHPRPDQ